MLLILSLWKNPLASLLISSEYSQFPHIMVLIILHLSVFLIVNVTAKQTNLKKKTEISLNS